MHSPQETSVDVIAARKVWTRLRVDPVQHDFERIDRAILRAAAEERLKHSETSRLRGVFWPGLLLTGVLAAAGIALVVTQSVEPPAPAAEVTPAVAATAPELPSAPAGAVLGSTQVARVGRSIVRVDAGSAARVVEVSEAHTLVALDSGSARFEVGKRTAGAAYVVDAGRVTVTVVGTAFNVSRSTPGVVRVAVEHGVVRVALDGRELRVLRAGESLDVPTAPPVPEVVEAPPAPAASEPPSVQVEVIPPTEVAVAPASPAPPAAPEATQEPVARARPRSRAARAEPAPAASAATVAEPAPQIVVQPYVPTEDPALAASTESLRRVVAGLSPAACQVRAEELRSWVAANKSHPKRRVGQQALAYCFFHTGRKAEADRLFKHLGLRIKDILDPQPPRL